MAGLAAWFSAAALSLRNDNELAHRGQQSGPYKYGILRNEGICQMNKRNQFSEVIAAYRRHGWELRRALVTAEDTG